VTGSADHTGGEEPLVDLCRRPEDLVSTAPGWRSGLAAVAALLSDVAALFEGPPPSDDETVADLEAALEELGRALEMLADRLAEFVSPAGPEA